MQNDEDTYGSKPFSEEEKNIHGCDPDSAYSRYIRRTASLCDVYVESVIDDLRKKFRDDELKEFVIQKSEIEKVCVFIDQRVVDLAHMIRIKHKISKPLPCVVFSAMRMATERDWPSQAFAVRVIDTYSKLMMYREGKLDCKDDLIKRNILKG